MTDPSTVADARHRAVRRAVRELAPATLLVVCAEADPSGAGGGVVVRLDQCLADVARHRLVDLAVASGGDVVVAYDACADTPENASAEALARLTGGRVRARTTPVAPSDPTTLVDVAHPPVSRRQLLRGTPAGRDADESGDDETRLLASLRALGVEPVDVPSPGPVLQVEGCTACGVCVRACPHQALELRLAAGLGTLLHRPDRCRGEQQCVATCPEQDVRAVGQQPWPVVLAGEALPLATLSTGACRRCGATIPRTSPGDLCGPCAQREREPFGWRVPEHLRDRLPERWRRD